MSSLFSWFDSIISWFGLFIPRRIIVRKTDRLIKFRWDGSVTESMPGLRWYWPFTTEIEEISVVRQPLDIQPFSIVTKDMIPALVDATIVYDITDAIQFITENFDPYTAIAEAVSASLRNILSQKTFKEIQESSSVGDELTDIVQVDVEDFGVNIFYCRLQNFCFFIPHGLPVTKPSGIHNTKVASQ